MILYYREGDKSTHITKINLYYLRWWYW